VTTDRLIKSTLGIALTKKIILAALIAIVWALCGVYNYGVTLAYFQSIGFADPQGAREKCDSDIKKAETSALYKPFATVALTFFKGPHWNFSGHAAVISHKPTGKPTEKSHEGSERFLESH
jgi:hypothetical protein